MDRIASFHVVREPPRRRFAAVVVMVRMLTDRWRLRRVDGLEFAKVLGTGRGEDTGPSADLRRQAYFLVWRDDVALRTFLDGHRIVQRWRSLDVERSLRLELVLGHGTWSGRAVVDGMRRTAGRGEVVVLTRARIRLRRWTAFRRVSRITARVVPPGRCWVIGVGELPVGRLGTFSGWRTSTDLDAWLAADETHARAAAHAGDWFAESLFARFAPTDLSAWNGSSPDSGKTEPRVS